MAVVKAANVTKYTASGSEGSGDNYIPDGYIKSVEKVWIDSYAFTSALSTLTSIHIGKVPKGKKLTDVIVYFPALIDAGTTQTISLGTAVVTAGGTVGTLGLMVDGIGSTAIQTASAGCAKMSPTGALQELSADSDIYIIFNAATTVTAGTIRSIIKYT
jgi:hypothetical protein